MTLDKIELKITTPTEPIKPGRGFYQIEDDTLFVQAGIFSSKHRFFSFLESDRVRLEFDRFGRFLFLELSYPRHLWKTDKRLKLPKRCEPADIRWLNFRERISDPKIISNSEKELLKIEFSQIDKPLFFYLANEIVAETDRSHNLSAIWITKISDDMAGNEIREFRRKKRENRPYLQ